MNLSRNRRTLMGLTFTNERVRPDLRNGLAYRSLWSGCRLEEGLLGKCDFAASTIEDCQFIDCDLDQAIFRAASIKNTVFIGGRGQYSIFENATLANVKFDLDLHGADLRFAAAENVDFSGSNLWGVSLNASCRFFKGMKFDDRSIRLFLALLGISEGAPTEITTLAGEYACKMMAKLSEES